LIPSALQVIGRSVESALMFSVYIKGWDERSERVPEPARAQGHP
jgi:hypothetical protein